VLIFAVMQNNFWTTMIDFDGSDKMKDIPADFLSLELFEWRGFLQVRRRTWRLVKAALTTS
jgi:hypothetical protein